MNKYQVFIGFQGTRTKEQYIQPGEYFEDDPLLHGQGAYLVSQGKAVLLGDVEEEAGSDIAAAIQVEINTYEASKKKVVKNPKAKKAKMEVKPDA